ncbi:MAG: TIGR01212 family radical SAM protein [Treponema sp.]|nr:TIGR01212 family radical SAM protein [Treponema sp.]
MHTTVSNFYKTLFNCKTYKISIDADCTCPNRDGSKAYGGCIFCSNSGSGDFLPDKKLPINEQVENAKLLVADKLKKTDSKKYIVYFQNFTNTYGNDDELFKKYCEALNCKDVTGIAIATRPDCISDSILSKISSLCDKGFVQIELGLQTTNEKTASFINRCCTNEDYYDAVRRIRNADKRIHIVTHIIFGLPGEVERDMFKTVSDVVSCCKNNFFDDKSFGIKIAQLYVLRGTVLNELYEKKEFIPLELDEYYNLIKNAMKLIDEKIIIHRITGDPPKRILAAPQWCADKKRVLNKFKTLNLF